MGLIGVGGYGYMQADMYAEMPGVELVAAADVSSDARELFERKFDAPTHKHHRSLLDDHAADLDAVTIVTPHTLHYEQVMACLERDLHVLVEKPMVTDVGDGVELVETAADRDLILQVGYQRHFHPGFRELRRVVRRGRIGELHAVNCHLGQDWIDLHEGTWRADPALSGGGQLYDTGSHLLDALLWTTGTTPRSVGAHMEYAEPEIDVNSALSLALEGEERHPVGSVVVSGDGVDVNPTEGYFYWGTAGRLAYVDGRIAVTEKGEVTYRTEITEGTDFRTVNRRKLENFVGSVQGDADPAVPGEFGLQVTALTEAAYRAAENHSTVDVQALVDDARTAREDELERDRDE